jgi:nicotinate-nucleotide pyrophosphorylase (carboxylating)
MVMLTPPPIDDVTRTLLKLAVREDVGSGDQTVRLALPADLRGSGTIVARRAGVIAGTYLLGALLAEYDAGLTCRVVAADGTRVEAGAAVAEVAGPARALLSAERVMLNFLGHLSGIATLTRRYVDVVNQVPAGEGGRRPVICDTRKTTPGFRALDKYAVRCGGGVNHRIGLYDGVMLKDNHLAALRERLGQGLTLAELTRRVRGELEPGITLWLEVDTLEQLGGELRGGGADIVLLDNFTPDQMRQAVKMRDAQSKIENRKSKILLEASGGITLENLAACAETGVDRISIGALTHSAPVLDLSLELA